MASNSTFNPLQTAVAVGGCGFIALMTGLSTVSLTAAFIIGGLMLLGAAVGLLIYWVDNG